MLVCRYAQVISELGSVIDFVPPPLFQEIIMALREYLSIVNFASAKWYACWFLPLVIIMCVLVLT